MAQALGYVHEQFYAAVLSLASGRGTVQERLESAFLSHLQVLTPEDFPEVTPDGLVADDRRDFRDLAERITARAPRGGAEALARTTEGMSDDDAERLIGIIVSLYNTITELHGYEWYHAEQQG